MTERPKKRIPYDRGHTIQGDALFFHVPVRTQQGMAYFFSPMDVYSEFIINLGTSKAIDEDTIIEYIKKLLKHKDFKRSPKKPFTLVSAIGEDYGQRIRAIPLPEKGKFVFDADAVQQNTKAFSEFFNERRA